MKSHNSRVLIASLMTLIAATAACEAPVEQSDSDLSALPPGGQVRYYCSSGTGSFVVPQDAETDVLSLNAALMFAYAHGDVAFDECDKQTALAVEKRQVAGWVQQVFQAMFRWLNKGEQLAPITGSVLKKGATVGGKLDATATNVSSLNGIEETVARLHLKKLPESTIGHMTTFTVETVAKSRTQLLYSTKFPGETIVQKTFLDVLYGPGTAEKVITKVLLQNGIRREDVVIGAIREGGTKVVDGYVRNKLAEVAPLEKLLPLGEGERITMIQFRVKCTTPKAVENALKWLAPLE
jgi:hypothetical protein